MRIAAMHRVHAVLSQRTPLLQLLLALIEVRREDAHRPEAQTQSSAPCEHACMRELASGWSESRPALVGRG